MSGVRSVFGARRVSRLGLVSGVLAATLLLAACGGDDENVEVATVAGELATVTEDALPPGYEPAPMVELDGKMWEFDTIPGHYWKVLDDGYAVGLHFQSEDPFAWAEDADDNELLYVVYAIPGSCPGGNFDKSVTRDDVSVLGSVPSGFDHWHGVLGAGPKLGHWLLHMPVRDFTLAGPPGNPLEGEEITAGIPEFIPICEPQ